MPKPVINIADVELEPRLAAFAPSGPAAERFVFVGRAGQSLDYWEGE